MPDNLTSVISKLSNSFTIAQLNMYHIKVCRESIENIVNTNEGKLTVINKLLEKLRLFDKERAFLLCVSENGGSSDLTVAVNKYLGIEINSAHDALVVLNSRPFIDRDSLRPAVRQFFETSYYRILLINGGRNTGRSYSHFLIQHYLASKGFNVRKFDLFNETTSPLTIEDLVSKFINITSSSTSGSAIRDTCALASTKARGLTDFVTNWLSLNNDRTWCFVFDSYDREEVSPECREFVDLLITEIVNNNIVNVWVVVIGRDPNRYSQLPNINPSALFETIDPLSALNVKDYLIALHNSKNQVLSQAALDLLYETMTDNLTFPLSKQDLIKLEERLTSYIRLN